MSNEQDPNSSQSPEASPTPTSPWAALREAREARGLSLMDVAQHLKLTPRQIEAMEAGDLAHLPGPTFARGFLRNYARFLKLDPAIFREVLDVPHEASLPVSSMPLAQMPGNSRWPSILPALAVVVGLLLVIVAGWHYNWFEPRDEKYLAEVVAQSDASAMSEPLAASLPAADMQSSVMLDASAPLLASAPTQMVDVTPSAAVVLPASAPVPAAASVAVAKPAEVQSAAHAASSAASSAKSSAATVPVPVAVQSAPATQAKASNSAASSAKTSSASQASSKASSSKVSSSKASSSKASSSKASSSRASSSRASSSRASSSATSDASAQSAPLAAGAHRLAFSFEGESWVSITDAKGSKVYEKTNRAGALQVIHVDGPVEIVIGNAAQVKLTRDGKPVEITPSANSTVARVRLQ